MSKIHDYIRSCYGQLSKDEDDEIRRIFNSGLTHYIITLNSPKKPVFSHDETLCMYDVYREMIGGCKIADKKFKIEKGKAEKNI